MNNEQERSSTDVRDEEPKGEEKRRKEEKPPMRVLGGNSGE